MTAWGSVRAQAAATPATPATPATQSKQAKPAKPATLGAPRVAPPAGAVAEVASPVTPRRAFLYSLAIPGAGQAALGRNFWGGVFFAAEGLSLALVHRSAEDLRLARQFRVDSVPATYQVDEFGQGVLASDGRPVIDTWTVSRYSDARIRARRTHYEDWLAVVIFNHLFAGADAYVAAQLWDLPAHVAMRPAPDGRAALVATLNFR